MPRPRSLEPKRVVRKLSDGSTWAYLYDRQSGDKISQERIDTPASTVKPGTIAALIDEYKATSHFKSRRLGTRKTYIGTLNFIADTMGDVEIKSVSAAKVHALKEALQEHPSKANQVLALLSILFNLAVKTGKLQHNPAANPGKISMPPRTQIWSEEAEARYTSELRTSLKLAFMLMLYTLQRFSDCLQMTKRQVIERKGRLYIVLTQSKTETLMAIPVHKNLDPLIRDRMQQKIMREVPAEDGGTRKVESLYLVTSPQGHPWLRRNASRAWDHDLKEAKKKYQTEMEEAGIGPEDIANALAQDQRQRRDLRRTGIVRLAERGASTARIAALSGHEIDYCQSIIDTYLPRRTEVALGAIELWETAEAHVVRASDEAPEESRAQRAAS